MKTPLPTFRALTASAVSLHVAALPYDGAGLLLGDLAVATPVLDHVLCRWIHHIQGGLTCAMGALLTVGGPEATALHGKCHAAWDAYHVALMAYFGVDVGAGEAAS